MADPASAGPSQGFGLSYRLISRLIHHPRLLRLLAAALKRKPSIARIARVVSGRDAVAAVFHRHQSFCTAHAPNLRAGEFVIGMVSGDQQQTERKFLASVLPAKERFATLSAIESRKQIAKILEGSETFDLINDYLAQVVWHALRLALGPAGNVPDKPPTNPQPDARFNEFVEDLRHLGAQLIIGSVATGKVRATADACAKRMNERATAVTPILGEWWKRKNPGDKDSIRRNAVGLMWVGHPATVQAGALCMQELLGPRRQTVLEQLVHAAQHVRSNGGDVWSDAAFRRLLTDHVLELMRFRPPFPILVRDVPRETWFDVDNGIPPGHAPAGSQLKLLPIGALFDDEAMEKSSEKPGNYCPGRKFKQLDDRYLMFGLGERACIAKDQVVEILVSALAGLLTLPGLSRAWYDRIEYDGPSIRHMRLRFKRDRDAG